MDGLFEANQRNVKRVNHTRELPQNNKMVAIHTDNLDVLIMDVEAQPIMILMKLRISQCIRSLEISDADAVVDDPDDDARMVDTLKEFVVNIDACDGGNQLAMVQYVKDPYANYRKMEVYGSVDLKSQTMHIT
ncbi:hypothetical protein HanXRQr2_Chr11g0470491 [Helianthus annuus]|uniref:Uncharacterized protein n=1 Tax=Helianthus annuus TaxID=4232 RepID=A0A9K3HLG5_HELAN|nr:hypothetical protein HanXRQr2_Chr11g0470491 [Helianthus annuus]KAJ0500134.1 hypothetical protein HanHA300_Chr11g0386291 [Helianthus annuus]KAJ0507486.1 hypothetical protein HanIR_Chr11g0506751 [Helianthus annuus]KAJ0515976.1 hypothetical protein HanHA89_Chr11g0408731 [Helianthus annuus]KAJ0683984.1 hypothetical protein HanLR1_Chr11g0386261 [Helianthus annuus]